MIIFAFCPHYLPYIGGLENYADQLHTHLVQKRNIEKIVVITTQIPESATPFEENGKIIIFRFPAWEIIPNFPIPAFWRLQFWKQLRTAKLNKPDVVMTHTRFFLTSLWGGWWAWRSHAQWLHIEHGSTFPQLHNHFFSFLAQTYDKSLGRIVLRSADVCIAVSISAKTFVLTLVPHRKVEVIYRGFDHELIDRIAEKQGIREQYKNRVIITFVGRLIDGKGVRDLVTALVQQPKKIICFIIGEGPERQILERQIDALGLHQQVKFLGQLPFQEVMGYVKASDIFVNPSYSEGLPTVVVEAALAKVAIVATDVGGTREILSSAAGIIISPRRPDILASVLQELIANKSQRRTLAQNAYNEVMKKFGWEQTIRAFARVMRKAQ